MLAELDGVTVAYVAAGVLVAWAAFGLFRVAADTLTAIGVGVLLALAFDPLVQRVRRRTGSRRAPAVAAVGTGLLVAFVAVAAVLGPPAAERAARFGTELPDTVRQAYELPVVGERLERADAVGRVQAWVDDLPGQLTSETLRDAVDRVLGGAAAVGSVLLVAFAVLLDGERLVARVRRLVPAGHRARADWAGRIFYRTMSRYFAGSLLLAVMAGTWTLTYGLALGVPLAPLAAVWVMLTNLIPQVGGFLGGSVVVVLAVTAGLTTGIVALACFVVYMSTENYVLQPAVVGKAVDLTPPSTMLAAFVGGATAGVPGALVATPLLAATKAMYLEVRFGVRPEDEEHRSQRSLVRRARDWLRRR